MVPELAGHAAPEEGQARRRGAALATLAARLKRHERSTPAAGERTERLARIVALAQQALGDEDEARAWLNARHPLLGASRPIDLAATDLGAKQVERILHDIEHDLPV